MKEVAVTCLPRADFCSLSLMRRPTLPVEACVNESRTEIKAFNSTSNTKHYLASNQDEVKNFLEFTSCLRSRGTEAKQQVRRRKRKKVRDCDRQPLLRPPAANEV